MMTNNKEFKEKLSKEVLNTLRKGNLIYNPKDESYTLFEKNLILNDESKQVKQLELFVFTKKDIYAAIDKVIDVYDDIVQLNNAGITLVNAKNMREEARELRDEYNTYMNIYLNAPIENGERVSSLAGCWNFLVEKCVITDESANRYEDYAKYYTRLYRLIVLVETKVPTPIINKELALLAESTIRKDCFLEFGLEKDTNEVVEDNEIEIG